MVYVLRDPPAVGVAGPAELLARDEDELVADPARVGQVRDRPVVRDGHEVEGVALVLRVHPQKQLVGQVLANIQRRGDRIVTIAVLRVLVQVSPKPALVTQGDSQIGGQTGRDAHVSVTIGVAIGVSIPVSVGVATIGSDVAIGITVPVGASVVTGEDEDSQEREKQN